MYSLGDQLQMISSLDIQRVDWESNILNDLVIGHFDKHGEFDNKKSTKET